MRDLFSADEGPETENEESGLEFNIEKNAKLGDKLYRVYGYPSKIYYKKISTFIEHYTEEGDTVLDPMVGSGSTAIASLFTNRNIIANDGSGLAAFVTRNIVQPTDPVELQKAFRDLKSKVIEPINGLYSVRCTCCSRNAVARNIYHSDIHRCPSCQEVFPLYGNKAGSKSTYECPECSHNIKTSTKAGKRSKVKRREPVEVDYDCPSCTCGSKRHTATVTPEMIERWNENLQRVRQSYDDLWMPEDKIVTDRWYTRSGGWPGFDKDAQVIDLFTDRNRLAIAIILDHIKSVDNKEIANQLKFNLISSLIRSSNRMYTTSVVKSYYQVPSVGKVQNVWSVFKRKFNNLQKSKKQLLRNAKIESKRDLEDKLKVYNLDARNIPVEDSSVDYVFFDPPYGSQVGYYELNLFYSAWLKEYSEDFENEIIIPMETDDEDEYVDKWGEMIDSVVSESGRILKDGGYLTIAFHSKYNKIWNKLIGVFEDNNFVFKDFVDFDRGTTIHTNRLSDTNVKSAFVTFLNTKERSIRSRTGDNGHSKEEIKSHLKNSLDLLEADFRRVRDEVVRAVYERDLGSVPSEEEIRSMLDDIS